MTGVEEAAPSSVLLTGLSLRFLSRDPEEQKRLKEDLARMTFGE